MTWAERQWLSLPGLHVRYVLRSIDARQILSHWPSYINGLTVYGEFDSIFDWADDKDGAARNNWKANVLSSLAIP